MPEDVYGFDRTRAERLKAIADHPKVINQLNLSRRRPYGSGGAVKYAFPPPGGIPAAVWHAATSELTPGVATCVIGVKDPVTGNIKQSEDGESVEVENQVTSVVGKSGKPMTIALNESGWWEVIVEDCNTSTAIASTAFNVPVDPISHGNSSQLSMGYGYEGV